MANTSKKVKARVAHTMTRTNCRMVVLYCALFGKRRHGGRLVLRANGGRVRIERISLSSVTSIAGVTRSLLKHKGRVSLLVGGTKAVDSKNLVAARSNLRCAMTIGCITPFLLALGLLPLVKRKAQVIGVISYACSVKGVAPRFFIHKGEKDF